MNGFFVYATTIMIVISITDDNVGCCGTIEWEIIMWLHSGGIFKLLEELKI